ncbi:hypothetical protein BOTBODRAFT_66824 [Botryobasidium botryosum FD-172 SS1]|uniref:Metallo-beta-lactamase domain-containing protein n=1 Tax=Botryobasidium botryosum (strain FD-172 SS1) TaxID=930990 RepID=A0A067MP44_BOTB1|nr:hypothetical protein BOTBODRAFT_66824 [Botryobasidium botryosum FD-172 SS1]
MPARLARIIARTVVVAIPASKNNDPPASRPLHHLNNSKSLFRNPWPSFRDMSMSERHRRMVKEHFRNTPIPVPTDIKTQIPSQKPTWGASADPKAIKATWLGHACFLVELPTPEGASRGPRILFDPALSHRCSPTQYFGPARFTDVPCKMEEIPEVDVVVISHSHYDHLDTHSVSTLDKLYSPHVFAPIGNEKWFRNLPLAPERTHCLDWWQSRHVTVGLPAKPHPREGGEGGNSRAGHGLVETTFAITCTPCQHGSGRTLWDQSHSLWSSWAIEELGNGPLGSGAASAGGEMERERKKVWFAGDTGYKTVREGEDEETVAVCPAFKEIGDLFGGFDLALIPIGAYSPRELWSSLHLAPQDSVRVFQDVRAKRAIGMHWGTWTLTSESALEPPRRLQEECAKAGIKTFDVCALGETVVV